MGGILHSSPVLTAGWVKKWYYCGRLVYLSAVILLAVFLLSVDMLSYRKAEDGVLVFYQEKGKERERENPHPSLFHYCRMSHEQFYAALFLPVKPGTTVGRSDPCLEHRATGYRCLILIISPLLITSKKSASYFPRETVYVNKQFKETKTWISN